MILITINYIDNINCINNYDNNNNNNNCTTQNGNTEST